MCTVSGTIWQQQRSARCVPLVTLRRVPTEIDRRMQLPLAESPSRHPMCVVLLDTLAMSLTKIQETSMARALVAQSERHRWKLHGQQQRLGQTIYGTAPPAHLSRQGLPVIYLAMQVIHRQRPHLSKPPAGREGSAEQIQKTIKASVAVRLAAPGRQGRPGRRHRRRDAHRGRGQQQVTFPRGTFMRRPARQSLQSRQDPCRPGGVTEEFQNMEATSQGLKLITSLVSRTVK